jgi:hypothetical protein
MMEESPAMLQRFGDSSIDREVAKQRRKLGSQSKWKGIPGEVIDALIFMYIRAFDTLAVLPAYYGTKTLMDRKYGPGEKSLRETEKVIIDTQPIARAMDMSVLQLNRKALSRMLTFFTTAVAKFENRNRIYNRGAVEGLIPIKKVLSQILIERVLPPILMNLLFTLGRGDEPDMEDMAWDLLLYQVIGYPIYRELALAGVNMARYATDDDFRGFSAFGTALSSVPDAVEKNMEKIAGLFSGDTAVMEAAIALADLTLSLKGIPAVKAIRDIDAGFEQFKDDDGFSAWWKLLVRDNYKER